MTLEKSKEFPMNEDTEKEIYECFSLFDTNKCGYIDVREFYFALKSLGLNFKKEEVKTLFLEVKKSINDKLNFDEFFDIASKHIHKRYNDEEIDQIFSLFDPNDTGQFHSLHDVSSLPVQMTGVRFWFRKKKTASIAPSGTQHVCPNAPMRRKSVDRHFLRRHTMIFLTGKITLNSLRTVCTEIGNSPLWKDFPHSPFMDSLT
ncbi:caltractin [Plasmodium ovale wallikeri]|uniref:Caltractin n=1 Tax=Plasmodium ovale wallikeri TaxID=864142 RepID=A0A1A8YUD7_PLAOA|nr:caltractin [Plasmodium ovale wallikeri]SBT35283.1 caltractin [Plasmodium ovale wallikeri]